VNQRTKKIRGLKTSWLESGPKTKPIMLFLHGFPDNAYVWSNQIKYFQKKFHIIAPFLRGVGHSEASHDSHRYHIQAVSLDLLAILRDVDPTGKKEIYIVAHDIGTGHAWYLAPLLGKRLKGLVVINGAQSRQFFNRLKKNAYQLLKSWYMYFFFLPWLPEIAIKGIPLGFKKQMLVRGGAPKSYVNHFQESLKNAHILVKYYRGSLLGFLQEIASQKKVKLKAPVLAISSLDDKFLEPANLHELEPLTEKPYVEIIEGKHWIMLEDPDRINKLINKFIQSNSRHNSPPLKIRGGQGEL